jgi:hypothetical protein
MTWTQTTLNIKDAANTTQPVIVYTDGTNFAFAHPILDSTGAVIAPATSGKQDTGNAALTAIQASAAAAATAAKQDTGNTSLGNVDTNLGAKADSAASTDTGTFSLIALFKRLLQTSTSLLTAAQAATPAGSNLIGKVTLDQTTPGTTESVTVATGQGAGATIGTTADALVSAGAAGSISAKLRRATQGLEDLKSLIVLAAGSAIIGKFGIDQTTPGTTNGVQVNAALPAGTNTVGAVASGVKVATGNTLILPSGASIYAFQDLMANSATAGSVSAPTIAAARGTDIPSVAMRCRLQKSTTTTTRAVFRVHYWNAAPSVTNGDNGVFIPTLDSTYMGYYDVTCNMQGTGSAYGISEQKIMPFTPASGTSNLYHLIEARDTYTPGASEVFTPYLEVM